jgi:hypothetical protein
MCPNLGAPQHGEMFLKTQTHQGESGSSRGTTEFAFFGADFGKGRPIGGI